MLPNNENKHLPRTWRQLSSLQELHCQQSESHLLCQHGTHSFPAEYNFPVLQWFYPLCILSSVYLVLQIFTCTDTHESHFYVLLSLISRVEHSGVFHKSRDVPKLDAPKKASNPFVWRMNIKEVPRSINNSVCHRRLVNNNNTLPVFVSIWRSCEAQSLHAPGAVGMKQTGCKDTLTG